MAKQRLKEIHANKLSVRLKRIREEQSYNRSSYEVTSDSTIKDDLLPSTSKLHNFEVIIILNIFLCYNTKCNFDVSYWINLYIY